MEKIGAAVYLHLANLEEIKNYTELLAKNNIKTIFTTLISFKKTDYENLKKLVVLTQIAKKYNIHVFADINIEFINEFNLNLNKRLDFIKFFKMYGLSGIRCNEGIDIKHQAKLSQNRLNFKIFINGSYVVNDINYLILFYKANVNNLISCYNFYPQRYTGADIDFFCLNQSESVVNKIPFASFVTLLGKDKIGPWKYNDNLPTLELHRDWPLVTQIRHYIALCIDMIIIANQFLTEYDLKMINEIDYKNLSLKIELNSNITDSEQQILFDKNIHKVRSDLARDIIRSVISRVIYQELDIPANNTNQWLEKGDVVILNNKAQNYRGELHIITNKIKNDGIRNVVGKLSKEDLNFIPFLVSNRSFRFIL
ncbi:MAG: MupG family TIM beta-alpha barrel fold protein [Spiroplasma endosymbiont of Drosophila atripex]|nr:MAG: MupG family TIM beta-alpha barrel fold protein [Spiroplasma endosymbiont of Drosophila atripex]